MVPRWKQIAFAASMPGKRFHVYIVSADGGVPKEVSKGDATNLSQWSQDGNSLFSETSGLIGRERYLSTELEDQPTRDRERL